ncbi:unnamed protein product [Closterium sp. Naga37s-1]|nr:unnamed protein product [Closterium sp. Naga37s-1]
MSAHLHAYHKPPLCGCLPQASKIPTHLLPARSCSSPIFHHFICHSPLSFTIPSLPVRLLSLPSPLPDVSSFLPCLIPAFYLPCRLRYVRLPLCAISPPCRLPSLPFNLPACHFPPCSSTSSRDNIKAPVLQGLGHLQKLTRLPTNVAEREVQGGIGDWIRKKVWSPGWRRMGTMGLAMVWERGGNAAGAEGSEGDEEVEDEAGADEEEEVEEEEEEGGDDEYEEEKDEEGSGDNSEEEVYSGEGEAADGDVAEDCPDLVAEGVEEMEGEGGGGR